MHGSIRELIEGKEDEEVDLLWSAELPPDEATNPALWNALVNFFEAAISRVTANAGTRVLSQDDIQQSLMRDNRAPSCTLRVIDVLKRRKVLSPALDCGDYAVPIQPLLVSSGDGSRVASTRSAAARSVQRWARSIFGRSSDWRYLYVQKNLENAAELIEREMDANLTTDSVRTVEEVASGFCDGNVQEALRLCAFLGSISRWNVMEISPGKYGVKISRSKVTSTDATILSMKATKQKLARQEEDLSKAASWQFQKAKEVMASTKLSEKARKSKAISLLKQRKMSEARTDHIQKLILHLERVLLSIDEAQTNREVMDSIEKGSEALKEVQLDVSQIDEVMLEMEGVLEVQVQINDALTHQTAMDAALEEAAFKELEMLDDVSSRVDDISSQKADGIEVSEPSTSQVAQATLAEISANSSSGIAKSTTSDAAQQQVEIALAADLMSKVTLQTATSERTDGVIAQEGQTPMTEKLPEHDAKLANISTDSSSGIAKSTTSDAAQQQVAIALAADLMSKVTLHTAASKTTGVVIAQEGQTPMTEKLLECGVPTSAGHVEDVNELDRGNDDLEARDGGSLQGNDGAKRTENLSLGKEAVVATSDISEGQSEQTELEREVVCGGTEAAAESSIGTDSVMIRKPLADAHPC